MATARAAPPVPTSSQERAPSTPSCLRHASTPGTSVLSDLSSPRSVQNVLHAPTRAQRAVFRAGHRSAASLCGPVRSPAAPTTARAASTGGSASAGVGSATYTASRPRARSAALCMMGDSEWVTGSPITASSRVLALISTARKLFDDPLHRRVDKGLELDAGVAVDLEVASERVAHLCGVALAPGVLAQHEDMALAAQLVDAGAMMAGHGQDEIRLGDQLPREQTGAVRREVEAALQPHEVIALRHRRPVPPPGPGGRHLDRKSARLNSKHRP